MRRKQRHSRTARAELTATAARMIVDGTAADFASAKRKAARELGVENTRDWPDNIQLHQAVADHLVLFEGAEHELRVRRMRTAALRAMHLFSDFSPRLTGPALYGTVCSYSAVQLHLISEEFEAVTRFLLEQRLRYDLGETRLRMTAGGDLQRFPLLQLQLFEECFELLVFRSATQHPISPLNDRPMKRAGVDAVGELLHSGQIFFGAQSIVA